VAYRCRISSWVELSTDQLLKRLRSGGGIGRRRLCRDAEFDEFIRLRGRRSDRPARIASGFQKYFLH
jgi:hypothetical protein